MNEWANRLGLEQMTCSFRPFYLHPTYAPGNVPESAQGAIAETQKFFKRLRKAGYQFRYFCATEEGSKTKRLHHHLILWWPEMARAPIKPTVRLLEQFWGQGHISAGRS